MTEALATEVGELLALLDTEPEEAIEVLSEIINSAYGEEGELIGEVVRSMGGLEKVVAKLSWWNMLPKTEDTTISIQQTLQLLGNLASDAVDCNSLVTKRQLLACGGAAAVLACLHTDDEFVLLLTCGALQNLCQDAAWCQVVIANAGARGHSLLRRRRVRRAPCAPGGRCGCASACARSSSLAPAGSTSGAARRTPCGGGTRTPTSR